MTDKKILEKNGDIAAAIEAGTMLACVQNIKRDKGERTCVVVKDGYNIEKIDNNLSRPERKTGRKIFVSAKSFCNYVNKHKSSDETVIIADEDLGEIEAVINDHGKETPAWGDFRVLLKLGFSDQWKIWFENCNLCREKLFGQVEFADFIEDNRADLKVGTFQDNDGNEVENLSALELSALMTNLQVTSEEKFISKIDMVSGRMTMSYENEETGKGNVIIPKQIFLAIPVYRDGDLFQVKIRIRHRLQGGSARFFYIIDQIPLLKKTAFDKICKRITDGNAGSEEDEKNIFAGTGLEVLKGIF